MDGYQSETKREPQGGSSLILLAVCGLGLSSVITQLALMREMLGAFSGNEMVLGIILGNWLLLTGIGAWLGRTTNRRRNPRLLLVLLLLLVALMPLAQMFLLRALRNVVFVRGALVGVAETVAASFVLLLPYCLVSGFLLTLACSILAEKKEPAGIGRVYVADSIGSIVGGALFSFLLVRWLDHFAMLYLPALLNLAVAGIVAFCFGRKILAAVAAAAGMAVVGLMLVADVDAVSTARQYPGQKIVFRRNSPYGKLIVTESAGQLNFIENGLPIISTHNVEQVEETVHYAMAQRPDARKVLLVSGGVSGTAKEILKYGVAEVTYVELDPLIIAAGRKFLPESMADARIKVVNTDGRLFVKQVGQASRLSMSPVPAGDGRDARPTYDAVIVDAPAPSTSQINRFYTAEFFAEVKRVLAKDGVLSFSLGRYENYVSKELARILASANVTLKLSFQNVLVIPGGRVFFVASDGKLFPNIAARIEQRRIPTQLVNRHYLDAMLTPDRMADMQRAISQPAAVNADFSPILYYYHLVHWMSQFKTRFGVLVLVVLVVALAVYLFTIRPVSLAIFVSGFAASALEVVLLLGFQILYGSVYQQLGIIVTVFMTGLAVGAWVGNRGRSTQMVCHPEQSEGPLQDCSRVTSQAEVLLPSQMDRNDRLKKRRTLAMLAFAIAALSALLPLVLIALGRLGGAPGAFVVVQATVALLTFILAVLVGMEFPVASQVEFVGGAATASRLYTADFVGASLGALLASTFLIPLIGVTAVCLLTAALNVIGGAGVLLRKG